MRPDDITIALLRRALILLRAYAEEAKSIDRRITCHDIAEELAEAIAPRSARLMAPVSLGNASTNRGAL